MDTEVRRLLLVGIFIRLLLMPFFTHDDLPLIIMMFTSCASNGGINPYEYFSSLGLMSIFPYPPLYYEVMLPYFYMLNSAGIVKFAELKEYACLERLKFGISPFAQTLLYEGETNILLFFAKIPYLFFDIGAALVLLRLDRRLFMYWIFCPITIWVSYVWGQFDIIPVFFVVVALYYAKISFERNCFRSACLSMLSLGMGIAFKMFPLFFVPFFAIFLARKDIGRGIMLGALALLPLIVASLPFINSLDFIRTVFLSSRFTGRVFYGSYTSPFFLGAIASLMVLGICSACNFENLWRYCFAALSFFYMFVPWHPQWFVWIAPFIGIALINYGWYRIAYGFQATVYSLHLNAAMILSSWIYPFSPVSPYLQPNMNESLLLAYVLISNSAWLILVVGLFISVLYLSARKKSSNEPLDKNWLIAVLGVFFFIFAILHLPLSYSLGEMPDLTNILRDSVNSGAFIAKNNGISGIDVFAKSANPVSESCLILSDGNRTVRQACVLPEGNVSFLRFRFDSILDSANRGYEFNITNAVAPDGFNKANLGDECASFKVYFKPDNPIAKIVQGFFDNVRRQFAFFLFYFVLLGIVLLLCAECLKIPKL
ncbi:MAG: hypothetical protein QXP42_02125 [Candidatus Micrarchaeia archaeon]